MLTSWTSFFALTGTSAATLTGLMFVVITLVTGPNKQQGATTTGFNTFSTPTVLHFATALLVSGVLSAPWTALTVPAVIVGVASFFGAVHMCRIVGRTRTLDTYKADLEDWVWFNILPLGSYLVLLIGAIMLPRATGNALYVFGASVLLQLFIGIHNSWDVVTYLAARDDTPEP